MLIPFHAYSFLFFFIRLNRAGADQGAGKALGREAWRWGVRPGKALGRWQGAGA